MEVEKHETKNNLTLIDSWPSEDVLFDLTAAKRENRTLVGVVRAVLNRTTKKLDENKNEIEVSTELLMVALENGATGYCTTENFALREYRKYAQFVGVRREFYIADIQLDTKFVFLDGKRALSRQVNAFWDKLKKLDEQGKLSETVFEATVSGSSPTTNNLFVTVEGMDALLPAKEWSYNANDGFRVDEGEKIQVIVTKANFEKRKIVVSRRLTLPNPTELFSHLTENDVIVGRVVDVNPLHGIRVELENNVIVKASRRRSLEEPIVGDFVSCRIVTPIFYNEEEGYVQGRVLIRGYPNGKAKRRNLGAFLFD